MGAIDPNPANVGSVTSTDIDPVITGVPAKDAPTGLKPVLDIIPAEAYEQSNYRAFGLIGRDFALYGLVIWGLLSTNNPLLLVPLWIASGVIVAALFVLGHDAAHGALFASSRLNALFSRVTMLPSLHAVELWIYGHNRVHHGHTLKEGVDFVWHPLTVVQYGELGRFGRALHKIEWSFFGAGTYYLRNVWWNKMMRFPPPARWRTKMRRDKALVIGFAVVVLGILLALSGLGGIWLWVKIVVVPFLGFTQCIGWVVYVHHISPEIRWWKRREWNRFRGQVEGTTILWGPPGFDLVFHSIMVHLPHHVDMGIPCYRLKLAASAIAESFPDYVEQRPIRLSDYRRATRTCKLYDFDAQTWLPYSALNANA